MENWNRLCDFPRCPRFFIDNRLPSGMYVIRRSHFPSCLYQHWSSEGLIATVQSLFGDRSPTFGFVALPLVGVVLFPSSAI